MRESLTAGARKCTKRLQLMHPFVDISDVLPKKAAKVGSWRDGLDGGLDYLGEKKDSEESSVELGSSEEWLKLEQ